MTNLWKATLVGVGLASAGTPEVQVFGAMGPTLIEKNREFLIEFAHRRGEVLGGFVGQHARSLVFPSPINMPERYVGIVLFQADSTSERIRRGRAIRVACKPFGDQPWWPERPVARCAEWKPTGDMVTYVQLADDAQVAVPQEQPDDRFDQPPVFLYVELSDAEVLGIVSGLRRDRSTAKEVPALFALRRGRDSSVVAWLEVDAVTTKRATLGRDADGWTVLTTSIWQE